MFDRDNKEYDDFILRTQHDYFSKPSVINIAEDVMDLPTYCEYCKERFRLFNSLVNGVCQSCGRNAALLVRNKQQDLGLSSLTEKRASDLTDTRIVSSYYDYGNFLNEDETRKTREQMLNEKTVKANSFMEAINLIHKADSKKNRDVDIYPKVKTRTTLQDYVRKEVDPSLYIRPTDKRRGYYEDDNDDDGVI